MTPRDQAPPAPGKSASAPRRRPVTILLRVLRVLAVAYLGVLLVLLFLENKLVYFPLKAEESWEPPPNPAWQDVYLSTADGTQIHGWWCPDPSPRWTVLFCHGNAGNLSHRGGSIVKLQSELPVSVLIFDYPGYGKSGGRPGEEGCYAAGEAAYRWLTDGHNIPPEKIILWGRSLGGGVATELATRHRHAALVLATTFTSLPDVGQVHYPWLPVRWFMRNRFDNLAKIGKVRTPVAIWHGTDDYTVPYDQGERLYEAANEPKLFYRLDGGHHESPTPLEFFDEVRRLLDGAGGND